MTTYVHRCLILSTSQQAFAQGLCEALAGYAGAGMFTTALSATGNLPATHYISAGMIEDAFAGALSAPAYLYGACQQAAQDPSRAEEARAFLAAVTPEQCQQLLESSDASDEEPFAALSRLGLQLVPHG